jgi:cell fate (sporulation/competence/biofilm development) regulator YmcA (YheA/YmcA/DUF963 family)
MGELLMEINKPFDNLIDIIKDTTIYQEYTHILEQVKKNTDINNTVKDIKNIQKKIVNEKYRGNDIKTLEKELSLKNKYLDSIPLYQDYIDASKTLNELVTTIINRLQTYLNDLDI